MKFRKIIPFCFLIVIACFHSLAISAEYKLIPITADGTHSISGQEITLTGGGQRIQLEVFLSGWDPDLDGNPKLRGWQVRINSCTYGIEGSVCVGGSNQGDCCVVDSQCFPGGICANAGSVLLPADQSCTLDTDCDPTFAPGSTCVRVCLGGDNPGTICTVDSQCPGSTCSPAAFCRSGFVDTTRPDYIFFGIGGAFANAGTVTLNYLYGGGLFFVADSIVDDGSDFYGGTLVLDVSLTSIGTYTISFSSSGAKMSDPGGISITPINLFPATVIVKCDTNANCEDGNQCTDDICEVDGTCSNTNNFDDTIFCCAPIDGALTVIDDNNDCTDDICNIDGTVDHPNLAEFTACGDPTSTDCNNPDTCNGLGQCLSRLESAGTICGSNVDTECDNPDTCDASGNCLDNFEIAGTICGSQSDTQCDNVDSCNGSGTCLTHHEPNGTTCNDGFFCTVNDACLTGQCTDNDPRNCDDSIPCTTDSCNDVTNVCDNILNAGFCLIAGTCQTVNTIDPSNDCMECNPSISTATWSPRSFGSICDDGIFCTMDDACDGTGICVAVFKVDGTVCPGDGNDCTEDICQSGNCTHPFEVNGFLCGNGIDTDCDNPDTCDGIGFCLDNHENAGFECGNPAVTQCDLFDICDAFGNCTDNPVTEGIECDDGDPFTANDTCDGAGSCAGLLIPEASEVIGFGPRNISVTPLPADSPVPVALRISSPDWPCLLKFVDVNGSLVLDPVFQTPAEWSTINLQGPDIVPDTTYVVETIFGVLVGPPGFGSTSLWGDLDLNGRTNIDDVLICVNVWLGLFLVLPEVANINPCIQDALPVRIDDVLEEVFAWLGGHFPCDSPCP